MRLTRDIAHAAAADAGKRHARAAGRTTWDETDYAAAVAEWNRLYDIIEHQEQAQEHTTQGGKA